MTKRIPPRDTPAIDWLRGAGACDEAVTWVRTEGIATIGDAWVRCTRPDWLIWALDEIGVDTRFMVALACWCVRHTTMPDGSPFTDLLTDPRSRRALKAAEGWVSRRYGERKLHAANRAAWNAVMELTYHDSNDPRYAASVLAYYAAEVGRWVSALPSRSQMYSYAEAVCDYLDMSVVWAAIRDGCDHKVAMHSARVARVDGIRSLIDPWAPDWTGPSKLEEVNG